MRKSPEKSGDSLRVEVLLVLLATGAGIIENSFPRPLPFIKLGLANVITVAAIAKYGLWTGLRLNILRATGAALFIGTIATPTYILSLIGGTASALLMGGLRKVFSVTGMSISGSLGSMSFQLAVASLLLPGLPVERIVMPIVLWSFLSGTITGIVAIVLLRRGFPWIETSGVDSG